ncbi:hypothetical protein EXIGLDRAFT_726527 [Exidia glandulosa HHB12029]|uniref:Uncharacterized protein n=1 Tax=Exidia glandulosa HHB12029 TaxID=1314781 RepID=A0A165MC29_EXIGL|nr:hypothetical protein EXIGLDRAFT_726527 [Exidia glandulosa HHB12029]
MDAPTESSSLLPRAELPEIHHPLPALMPYVRGLPQDHHPSFQEIKFLSLPEASASARAAFGLLALLYLICEPEEPLPRFATPWDEWQELERRQTRHANLEAAVLRYWQEFEQDEAEKDLEELLWTEFLLEGDSDKVLRVADYLANPLVPSALLTQASIELALLRAWEQGVPTRCRVVETTEPPILQRYDSITTPRIAHAIALGIQLFYMYQIAHYVLWPNIITIYKAPGDTDDGDEIDYISNPREVFIVIFSLSDLLARPYRRPQSFASLLAFLSFLLSFPDTPKPRTTPFSFLLLSLILHTFNLHFSLLSPTLLLSPSWILPLVTLYRLLIVRVLRPAFYFCLPAILGAAILLSTSLDDINLIVRAPLNTISMFSLASAPEETRLTSLIILGLAVAMMLYLIHGVATLFPIVIAPPRRPISPWDAYDREIGIVARRTFVTALLRYSEPYFFPATIRLMVLVCVSLPASIIRLTGKTEMALRVREGVKSLLWRALIGPAGVLISLIFWRWWR